MAIIPARGGSKRIPRKNIRDLNGKPLLAWSLQMATSSGLFSRVLVSTDDEEIEQIASDNGAQVSSRRPAQLSDDFASTRENQTSLQWPRPRRFLGQIESNVDRQTGKNTGQ